MSIDDIFAEMNNRRRLRSLTMQTVRNALATGDMEAMESTIDAEYERSKKRMEAAAKDGDDSTGSGESENTDPEAAVGS